MAKTILITSKNQSAAVEVAELLAKKLQVNACPVLLIKRDSLKQNAKNIYSRSADWFVLQNTMMIAKTSVDSGISVISDIDELNMAEQNTIADILGLPNIFVVYLSENLDSATPPLLTDLSFPLYPENGYYDSYYVVQVVFDHLYSMLSNNKMPTMEEVFNTCCDYVGVGREITKTKVQKREYVMARYLFMYFAPFLTGRSLKTCARYAGGKDHATGSYARKTIRNGLDPRFKSNYLPAVEGLNAIFENKYGIKVDKNAYIDPLDLGKN